MAGRIVNVVKTLNDAQMVSSRRVAMKSFAVKAGLAAAVVASGVIAAAGPAAAASDKRNQTDTDTGPRSDAVAQTDSD